MSRFYDTIFISESGFQEKIIQHLIEADYEWGNFLWIRWKKNGFEDNEGNKYGIDLNHVKGITKSFFNILKFPKLKCERLVGTQFTGVNCRFFEANISYSDLILIDDGIGTPVILSHPKYYSEFPKEKIKMWSVSFISILFKRTKLKTTQKLINNVSKYISVYPLTNKFINEVQIKLFNFNFDLIENVGFIGQPLVEYKMITQEYYNKKIGEIISIYGELDYFPDPSEKNIFNQRIDGLNIIVKNEPLENFLQKRGLPKILYTFTSSALLNLRISNADFKGFFIRIPNADKIRNHYYKIFNQFSLDEFK